MSEPAVMCCHVDGPSTFIARRTFPSGLTVLGTPIYGRILFREHGLVISDCAFGDTLTTRNVMGGMIIRNYFHFRTMTA